MTNPYLTTLSGVGRLSRADWGWIIGSLGLGLVMTIWTGDWGIWLEPHWWIGAAVTSLLGGVLASLLLVRKARRRAKRPSAPPVPLAAPRWQRRR